MAQTVDYDNPVLRIEKIVIFPSGVKCLPFGSCSLVDEDLHFTVFLFLDFLKYCPKSNYRDCKIGLDTKHLKLNSNNLFNVTDELSKCESQKLRQPFWELTYGQSVYIVPGVRGYEISSIRIFFLPFAHILTHPSGGQYG